MKNLARPICALILSALLLYVLIGALQRSVPVPPPPSVLASTLPPEQKADLLAPPPWMDPTLPPGQRADLLLSAMTLDEKITMVHGVESYPYVGRVPTNTRLGIPALILQDGPAGVAGGLTKVTAFPAPLTVAASWDTDLMQQYGAAMATEEISKGANVQLAPMMNMIRVPQAGRNWEGYSEDPYLAAQMAAADVRGIQSRGVIATAKHYIDNDQESERASISADIDDRTQHEIYLLPFEASVRAGAGAVMCAYNRINGTYACENAATQNSWLKGELGFAGWIMSDWGATHSTIPAANNGLDMEMPRGYFFSDTLKSAVQSGQVPQSRLDDMVRRILTAMFQMGLFDRNPTSSSDDNVQSQAHTQLARDAAAQGIVLLKNISNTLPLSTTQADKITVIGTAASTNPIVACGGSGYVIPPYVVTPLQGIISRTEGTSITVRYVQGDNVLSPIPSQYLRTLAGTLGLEGQYFSNTTMSGTAVITQADANIDFNWHGKSPVTGIYSITWSARWTGTLVPATTGIYTLALTSDDGSRLFVDGNKMIDIWWNHGDQTGWATMQLTAGQPYSIEVDYYQAAGSSDVHLSWITPLDFGEAITAASESDVTIVVVGLCSGEGSDRSDLALPDGQDALISAVAQANPRTIVVAYTPAQVLMPWADQPAAILAGWVPGQEAGHALASILFGDVNPSGKLPMTFAQNAADYPANTQGQYPGVDWGEGNWHVYYSEGLRVGYRHLDSQNITPTFPFGHGLSYTTFDYGNLSISPATVLTTGTVTVTMSLTNTGSYTGAEVVQLYLGFPLEASEPPMQLKGLQKVTLRPGQTQPVTFTLKPEAFSFWSVGLQRWVAYPSTYRVMVGASSRDIRLNGAFQVQGGPLVGTVYQAEDAALSGGAEVVTNHAGYTGNGFVDGYWNVGATTVFTVNASSEGQYNVTLRYANSMGLGGRNTAQTLDLYVNGTKVRRTSLPTLANWDMWDFKTESLALKAGENLIAYKYYTDTCDSGHVNLDAIIVGPGEAINLALGKPALASSNESLALRPSNAVDGDAATRWSSVFTDPQWIQVDLGAIYSINRVVLSWETTYGLAYEIQVSSDGVNWVAIYATATGDGGINDLNAHGMGRYIRMYGTAHGTSRGYSLREFEVYGIPAVNLALCKPATASSTQDENPGLMPNQAVDGNIDTRWSSVFTDPQWMTVDLGIASKIGLVVLDWETAYGKAYEIQTSGDGINWTTIYSTSTGDGGLEGLYVSSVGRYIRMYGTVRGTEWGYSLWEFEAYAPPNRVYLPIARRQ